MDVAGIIQRKALLLGLRPNTIKTYTAIVQRFLRKYKLNVWEVTTKDIEKHLLVLLEKNKSGSSVNVHLNALKFFFEKCLGKRVTLNMKFTKQRRKLPTFLTQEEIIFFLEVIENRKHKLMISLLYSAGLRVSELLDLKVRDLELSKNHGWVRDGKGGKERPFIIAERIRLDLENWLFEQRLNDCDYLFGNKGRKMSTQTVRKIIHNTKKKARIKKNIGPHSLRHSFATHFLEQGNALTELQPLLGHSRIETTLVYSHMASPQLLKMQSPFDNLEINNEKRLK